MDAIPSLAAHEPSSEQLSRIAAQLTAEASAAAATAAVAAALPAAPVAAGAAPPFPVGLAPRPFTPFVQPSATQPAAPLRTATGPLEDLSGLRSFVARIRGSDAFASSPPLFNAPAPVGVAGLGFFDVDAVRRDFPVLHQRVHGRPLAWFDNAATTQKPQAVIDAIARFYQHDNSNIHRGAHTLAARATDAYEHSRRTVQTFLGASSPDEIIFVRGTTEGINLVAQACGSLLSAGDEIVLTELEHHANIVPWQMVAKRTGAVIRVAPIDDRGEVILEAYAARLGRERIAAYEHEMLEHATRRLAAIDGLRLIGTAAEKVGVLSFVLPGRDVLEIGKALDREGFAVRAGHHCAQPSLRHFGVEATVRPSLAFYNTHDEIDRLADAVARIARG